MKVYTTELTGGFFLPASRRFTKIPLDNEKLSHWLVGVMFAWGLTFLLFLPMAHLLLKVPTATVATLTALFCAAQLAVTPWLFSARATRQNPSGRPTQRGAAVGVLACLMGVLFFVYIGGLWPKEKAAREFASAGVALTVLVVILVFAVRRTPKNLEKPGDTSNEVGGVKSGLQ